eukprot:jgi/Mesen1/6730/ME000344S06015
MSPNGLKFASGGQDHTVKFYLYPDARFEANVTRFTLPIRSLAFSVSGGMLAAAGDDEGIKLISTVDSSIIRVLKGHDGAVLSLAFDPKNEFLASADADGTVIYWEISSGRVRARIPASTALLCPCLALDLTSFDPSLTLV